MADDLQWKTTLDLMEDSLRWKTTLDLMEDDLRWKTTFDGRRPSLKRFRDSALPYTAVAVIFGQEQQKRANFYILCLILDSNIFLHNN